MHSYRPARKRSRAPDGVLNRGPRLGGRPTGGVTSSLERERPPADRHTAATGCAILGRSLVKKGRYGIASRLSWRLIMGEEKAAVGFWTTFPGMLTAIAGLITAVAALVGALVAANIVGTSSTRVTAPLPTSASDRPRLPVIELDAPSKATNVPNVMNRPANSPNVMNRPADDDVRPSKMK